MTEFNRKHPEFAAKLMAYIESGLNPDEIIAQFKVDDENKQFSNSDEVFPNEIRLISQALAYRAAESKDLNEIYNLLKTAYSDEVDGSESFRCPPSVDFDTVSFMFSDKSYEWLVVEAPSGRDVEKDGIILGVCCYSRTGVSRCNGIVEGHLGSIRLFGVLLRYRGFCIGQRLLQKAEDLMFKANCCRVMVCIPSPRVSMLKWIVRRNYTKLGACHYPAESLNHVLLKVVGNVDLIQFIKTRPSTLNSDTAADDKTNKVYAIVPRNDHAIACTTTVSYEGQSFDNETVSVMQRADNNLEGSNVSSSMTLPPLWRHMNTSASESGSAAGINKSLSLSCDSKEKASKGKDGQSTVCRHLSDSGQLDCDIDLEVLTVD